MEVTHVSACRPYVAGIAISSYLPVAHSLTTCSSGVGAVVLLHLSEVPNPSEDPRIPYPEVSEVLVLVEVETETLSGVSEVVEVV